MTTLYVNDTTVISNDDWNKIIGYFNINVKFNFTKRSNESENGIKRISKKSGHYRISVFMFYTKDAIKERIEDDFPNLVDTVDKVIAISIIYQQTEMFIDKILNCSQQRASHRRSMIVRTAIQDRYKHRRRK